MKNDPVAHLMEEHEIILKALRILLGILKSPMPAAQKELKLRQLIHFFRHYADGYHHHKEEELLFPAMQAQFPLLGDGILKEMNEQHKTMRELIGEAQAYLESGNLNAAADNLQSYAEILLDHISAENEEVFQIAADQLKATELETMYFRFLDIDRERGEVKKAEWVNSLNDL